MGRYGQAILTIAGTVVGSYFGYPQLGALAGSLAGSLLFPTQLPTVSGPRLSDISQTTSAVGTSIPRGWGTFPVPGQIIWQSDLREVVQSDEVGGKGAPEQTVETVNYFQDFAVGLVEGEDPITGLGAIAGVRRIWANGKIIYDRRPRQDEESETDFNARIAASEALDLQMVIYRGTDDQEPDPTIEAALGIGNISAFAGLAYIVFVNWQNKIEDGNRMPAQWRFEVYTSGAGEVDEDFEYSNYYLPPWNTSVTGGPPIYEGLGYYDIQVRATGRTVGSGKHDVDGTFPTLAAAKAAAEARAERSTASNYQGYAIEVSSLSLGLEGVTNQMAGQSHLSVGAYDVTEISALYNVFSADLNERFVAVGPGVSNAYQVQFMQLGFSPGVTLHTNGPPFNNGSPARAGVYRWHTGSFWEANALRSSDPNVDSVVSFGSVLGEQTNQLITGDSMFRIRRRLVAPGDQCAVSIPSLPGYCVSTRGNLIQQGSWEEVIGTARALSTYATRSEAIQGNMEVEIVDQYPLNPVVPQGHPSYEDQTFWEDEYERAVASNLMPSGLAYGVDFPQQLGTYWQRAISRTTVETSPIALSILVGDLLRESGYVASDYDVSALSSKTVTGFLRARVMSGRAAVEPLRQAKFFDGIESNGRIKFVNRGGPIVAALSDDDLGVAAIGEGNAPSRIATSTADETELPRQVRVHYFSVARDYEPGEQLSPPRIETRASNDTDIELPLVLNDDEAAQIAEVLWADAWAARHAHQLVIDGGRQELEPSDPIEIEADNRTHRIRIVSLSDSFPALRRVDAVRDDDRAYVSRAIGSTPGYVRQVLSIPSPVELILLDLPPLREEDNDPGVYAALRPYLSGSAFRGATILRSADGGSSYISLGPVGTAVPVGVLLSDVGDSDPWVWDEQTVISVQMQYGTLESRTEEAVLSGANAAAIGAHGRWEIVQFRNAEAAGDDVWLLSGLLRGRRGTEHNIATAITGDRFVMLSSGGLVRLGLNETEIGQTRTYKAVGAGTSPGDAIEQDFVGEAEALKPFSPVHVSASLKDDGGIELTWIRRDRFGQTLSGEDIPMSEATESYEVDVMVDGEVIRTIASSEQSLVYTAAQQALDFDSPAPAEISVRVHQISAVVGRGYAGELAVTLAELEGDDDTDIQIDIEPDADAIIVPLTYDESDQSVAPLTWSRNGNGPRITSRGLLGDGYEARLRATVGLPAYVTSATGPLYLRASIRADYGPRHSTADIVVSICENDASPNPRLEFAIVGDATLPNAPMVALRSYTGSMQTQRLARPGWRFAFTHPEKTAGGFDARPQGILHRSADLLLTAHYEDQFTRCHSVNPVTGELLRYFDFDPSLHHVGSIADDALGVIWFADYTSGHIVRVDVEASLDAGSAVIEADVDCSALVGVSAIEWVTLDGLQYLLVGEYLTAGTPYIYLFSASDFVEGAVISSADRVKRLIAPLEVQGIVYRDGELYIASSNNPAGGIIRIIDIDTWIESGADGESYATYDDGVTYYPPTEQVEDLDFDGSANLWTCTEGEAGVGDDPAFVSAWFSPLTPTAISTFSAFYDGAGTIAIRIDDKAFALKSWTPTPMPGAISIGAPPQAASGETAAFFNGLVRNVLIQSSDFNPLDYDDAIVYELDGALAELPVPLTNADAESGSATGWTNEIGSLGIRSANPSAAEGTYYFWGDANAQTISRQRVDLVASGLDASALDTGDCWIITQWLAATFTGQADTNDLGFRFLDASQVEISSSMSAALAMDGDTWIPRSYGAMIPANTRFIDVRIDLVRLSGANADGYVDDIRAVICIPTPN